ncbi:hypothetical protein EPUL_004468, partial [Erysiphe pulchra]
MLFSLTKVALTFIFVTKTPSLGLELEQSFLTEPAYYDCGSWIVYESRIQEMLFKMGLDIDIYAVPFIELLYDLKLDYWKVEIPKDLSMPKLLDNKNVVVEMKNGHYIKCKLIDESTLKPTNIDQNDYGYECGHELFSHEVVKMTADLAQASKGRSKVYPAPYHGPLYLPKLNYWIYPLSREMKEYQTRKMPENTYLVVISSDGNIVDMIAELMQGDFIKCVRTTKSPPDIGLDKDFRIGYSCGLEFFDINHMKRTANLAKAKNFLQRKLQSRQAFPRIYKDDSFEAFIYPLLPYGRFYAAGPRPLKHFIVMNLDFSIKFAAVKTFTGLTPCEESLRGIEVVPPETDNFRCKYSKAEFKNKRLLELVRIACKNLGTRSRRFPAIYDGPEFNIPGPYVTWPIKTGNTVSG